MSNEQLEALKKEHGEDIVVPYSPVSEIMYAFVILTILTVLELGIVFMEKWWILEKGVPLASFIIFLTFVKAYYIMAYFMHVKHEKLNFTYSIITPFILILYLLILLAYEAAYSF